MELLRGQRLGKLAPEAVEFTSSVAQDSPLVSAVVKVNQAHVVMLFRQRLLRAEDARPILAALSQIPAEMALDPALEDVHMNVEATVVAAAGQAAGGQLQLGKSRNDQVATALRLVWRKQILAVQRAVLRLREELLHIASAHGETLMPGYTHLQPAQPVTLALHLLAYHDAFQRDFARLSEAYERVNRSPLGAAALATSRLPLDRQLVADLLGFEGLVENSIDAVGGRDVALDLLHACAAAMTDLARLAEELLLWSSAEFGFVTLDDAFCSTSSIMPQKKNAVVPELVRARAATVYGHVMAAYGLLKALPYAYNLDLQELSPHVWEALSATRRSAEIMRAVIASTEFHRERMHQRVDDSTLLATDLADLLTVRHGVAFRQAHQIVGGLVRRAQSVNRPFLEVVMSELASEVERATGHRIELSESEVRDALNVRAAVNGRRVAGGPAPIATAAMAEGRRRGILVDETVLAQREAALEEADRRIDRAVVQVMGGEA